MTKASTEQKRDGVRPAILRFSIDRPQSHLSAATSPQKEYGYRNGELLITADEQKRDGSAKKRWVRPAILRFSIDRPQSHLSAATSPQKGYGYRNGELLITADVPTVGENDRASVGFSGVQGQTNWYYQDSSGAGMSYVSSGNWWQGAETYNLLWSNGGHPGNNSDAVRQWRAPQAGTIHVTGSASDANNACGDGVIVSILKGTQVLWQQTINNGNISGFSYDLTTTVTAGEQINFVINKRTDNLCDSTNFNPNPWVRPAILRFIF